MNVTVHVPPVLASTFDGRRRLELGLPPGAGPGELVQALLALYPRLGPFFVTDHKGKLGKVQMGLWLDRPGRGALREGQRVFLVADSPKRLTAGA